MKDSALCILQKHLQNPPIQPSHQNSILNIKSTNEGIGALQIIQSCILKCLQFLQNQQLQECLNQIQQCTFMGDLLFDRNLSLVVCQEKREFLIQTPQSMQLQEIVDYFQDKQEEINLILDWIFEMMDQEDQVQPSFYHHSDMIANKNF